MEENNNNKIHHFISERNHLIWWTQDLNNLSDEAIIEAVLNYGNWDDVQGLIEVMGVENIAKIFKKQLQQKRVNYSERTKKYFIHYFEKYA